MRRIAIITSSAASLVLFRGALIEALVQRGLTVLALAPDFDEGLCAEIRRMGALPIDYDLERTGTSLRQDIASTGQLTGLLRRHKPDGVLSYFMKPVIYGTLAARFAGVPRRYAMIEGLGYAFTDIGISSVRRKVLKATMQVLLRVSLRQARRVIFLNADDRGELVAAGIVKEGRTVVLGGIGLKLADFPPADVPREGPPVFVMISRLILEKGVFDFVEAARRVRREHPDARFLLVGGLDPKPGSMTREQLHALAAEGLIEWPGEVGDVRPFLREATAFVLPSYREGVPRSTQEAMAIGRAVITTDVPGCRATVRDGVNGFLVPPRDPGKVAEAMMHFVRDRSLAVVMGGESRRIAEREFDADIVNRRLLGYMDVPNV